METLKLKHPLTKEVIDFEVLCFLDLIELRKLANDCLKKADIKIRSLGIPDASDRPLIDHRHYMADIRDVCTARIQDYLDLDAKKFDRLCGAIEKLSVENQEKVWGTYYEEAD